mgnify:CR=1 FL=1
MFEYLSYWELKYGRTIKGYYISEIASLVIELPSKERQSIIASLMTSLNSKLDIEAKTKIRYEEQKEILTLANVYMNICESKYCFCFEYLMIKLLCVSNSPCNFLKTTEILFCSSNFGRRICMFPIVLFISFGFAKLVETYILVASAKTNVNEMGIKSFFEL